MKYNNKKLFTLLLVAAMVVMLLPTTALADADICGDFEYIDNGDGTCTVTGYSGGSLDVTIPDKLNDLTVTAIGMHAFENKNLTAVTIPSTTASIESFAFASNKLTSVTLPSSVEFIGANAFALNTVDSVTMTEFSLPEPEEGYISKWVNTDPAEFYGGDAVAVEDAYTRTSYQQIFDYYYVDDYLKIICIYQYNGRGGDVVIPETIDGYTVHEIGYSAFADKGITSVTLPDSIMCICENAFANNSGLASITLPASYKGYINTYIDDSGNEYAAGSPITDFTKEYHAKVGFVEAQEGGAILTFFVPDTGICVIPSKISDLTVWGVYEDACYDAGITELTLPDTITHIGMGAFADNELTSVILPSSIKLIVRYAFEGNEGLESFDLPEAPKGYTSYWNEYERTYGEVDSVESKEEMAPATTRPPETVNEVNGGYTVTNFSNTYEWVRNEPNEYTVTFKDADGTVIKTVTQDYGTEIEYPADPTKEGYTFNGWDSDIETIPAENLTITAIYISAEAPRGNITGTLVDSDGNPIAGKIVKLHSKVVTTVTDSKGRFTFTDVPLVDHELIIESTEGSELGRYDLSFGKSSSTSYSVDETDVDVNVTSSTVAIDILVNVSEEGEVSIEEITFKENPQTGDESTSWWILWTAIAAVIILSAGIASRRRATN